MRFEYQPLPVRVLFGAGRAQDVAAEVTRLGCSRALVVCGPQQRAVGGRIAEALGDLAVGVFDEAAMHTPVEVTERALARFRELGGDCTVAVGGGSTIGLSKALALRTDCPQVVLPTTYAGSEVTSILGETQAGVKKTQRSPRVLPEVVIYDVLLTLTLPASLSATSGMNSIAHAVEALYARDANPIVSLMAEECIRAFAAGLPRVVRQPDDVDARTGAQYGAWLGGTCLGAVGMALHHKICHALGGAFDLPHAQTHTVMLPHVTAYNAPAAPDAMKRIARALGTQDAAQGLHALVRSLDAPTSLRELGMPDELERAVDLVLSDAYWNPRPLEREAIRAMLARAYTGEAPQA